MISLIQKVSLFLKASNMKKVSYVLWVGFSDLLVGLVGPESPLDHRLLSLPWSLHGLFYPDLQQGLAFLYFPVALAHRCLLPGKQTNTNTHKQASSLLYCVHISERYLVRTSGKKYDMELKQYADVAIGRVFPKLAL